jgi:Flp pilus assembly protein TadD
MRSGDPAGAEPLFQEALRRAPGDAAILEALGALYARTDRLGQAEASFRAALGARSDSTGSRLGLAGVLIDTGRYDEALAQIAEVRRRDPDNMAALLREALLEARRGRPREAEGAARRIIERQPGHAEAHYLLGLALEQSGAFEEAAAAHRRAQEIAPGHLGTLSHLATLAMRLGRPDEAARWKNAHREALLRGRIEERVRGDRLRGVEAFNRGDYPAALEAFLAIARQDPGDPQVHLHLGSTYLALGDREQALRALGRCLELKPRDERALAELGRLHALDGRLDDAVRVLREAIAANPEFPEPHYYLAGVYRARGEADLFRQEIQRYEELRAGSRGSAMDMVPGAAGVRP